MRRRLWPAQRGWCPRLFQRSSLYSTGRVGQRSFWLCSEWAVVSSISPLTMKNTCTEACPVEEALTALSMLQRLLRNFFKPGGVCRSGEALVLSSTTQVQKVAANSGNAVMEL